MMLLENLLCGGVCCCACADDLNALPCLLVIHVELEKSSEVVRVCSCG